MKSLIVIGNGKLSDAIMEEFPRYSDIPVVKYSDDIKASDETVFVHIGSGRQYVEALKIAIEGNSTFIQAATEKDVPMEIPRPGDFKFISAPNLDLNIIRLFHMLSISKDLFRGENITIMESHQKEKISKAGTAIKIGNYLGCPEENIISIRDPDEQKKLNISNLHQHAFHEIKIGDSDSSITITTKIEGANGYVKGLSKIIDAVQSLDCDLYEIEDLIQLNLL